MAILDFYHVQSFLSNLHRHLIYTLQFLGGCSFWCHQYHSYYTENSFVCSRFGQNLSVGKNSLQGIVLCQLDWNPPNQGSLIHSSWLLQQMKLNFVFWVIILALKGDFFFTCWQEWLSKLAFSLQIFLSYSRVSLDQGICIQSASLSPTKLLP